VRNSITLSFQLETANDEFRMLFQSADAVQVDVPSTLSELMLTTPGPGYGNNFERLLFSPDSLQAMVDKLSETRMEPIDPPPALDVHRKLQQQAEAYNADNVAVIPADIAVIDTDITVSGFHPSADNFVGRLCVKARCNVHMPLG
jgi:hypothetical protein